MCFVRAKGFATVSCPARNPISEIWHAETNERTLTRPEKLQLLRNKRNGRMDGLTTSSDSWEPSGSGLAWEQSDSGDIVQNDAGLANDRSI